jgi:hypothetical protein
VDRSAQVQAEAQQNLGLELCVIVMLLATSLNLSAIIHREVVQVMYLYMYVCMHACMHVCSHYVCSHYTQRGGAADVFVYACMYACMHVCM